jgi:hypothetical protein
MSDKTLEIYFSPDNLKLAYYRIVCWPERLVKDRFGIHAFGAQLDKNCKAVFQRNLFQENIHRSEALNITSQNHLVRKEQKPF